MTDPKIIKKENLSNEKIVDKFFLIRMLIKEYKNAIH